MFHKKNKLNSTNQNSRVFRIIMCQSVVLILACGFFFFSGAKPASAASCECSRLDMDNIFNKEKLATFTVANKDECTKKCEGVEYAIFYRYAEGTIEKNATFENLRHGMDAIKNAFSDNCGMGMINPSNWVPCLLMGVLRFLGWILTVAAIIFGWAANAQTLSAVINGETIYSSWQLVRDILNIAFIMMLLYTAFTIIFQVDKTNKKIILTVVLMALLVNFSFPVARFIIDIGNSLMYTIFNSLFNGDGANPTGILTGIADSSSLADIITPKGDPTVAQLLASIVFISILAITFLMMAILFVIRIVVLAIVIIFSSVGFVGLLFPDISKKIDWWGNLFKYTFFGPAMAFMLYIAIQIMNKTIDVSKSVTNFGVFSENTDVLNSMATFAIPVVVLWIGMGVAQKMGVEGADMAKKWATKAVKFAALAPAKAAWWGTKKAAKVSGVSGGMKQKFDNLKSKWDAGIAKREAGIASKGPFAVAGAKQKDMQKRSDEYKKNFESIPSLQQKCSAGDAAACHRLAADGEMDHTTYGAMQLSVKDPDLIKTINKQVKDKRLDVIVKYRIANPGGKTFDEIIEEEYGELNAEGWANQKDLNVLATSTNPIDLRIINTAADHFNDMTAQARIDVGKKLSGAKTRALQNMANPFNIP